MYGKEFETIMIILSCVISLPLMYWLAKWRARL